MRVIDLGWPITNKTIVFPGDVSPSIKIKSTVEQEGHTPRLLTISTHTGTHIDAPAHMLADGETLDQLPNETYFGFAQVVDATRCVGRKIEVADIKVSVKEIRAIDFVLINTGWNQLWGKPDYLLGYPVLSPEASRWIAVHDLKGVGIDAISIDTVDTASSEIHKTLMSQGLIIAENLRNLEQVAGEPFCFVALPLSLENADGAPARIMAILN